MKPRTVRPIDFAAAAFTAAVLWLSAAGTASALAYTETGDAGDLPATAQVISGASGTALDSITGALTLTNGVSDADMFEIYIADPTAFSASDTAFLPGSNDFDSQLFLFSATGLGQLANDDAPAGGQQSSLPAGTFSGSAGLYYLLIGGTGRYPVSSDGLIFPNVNDGANGGLGDDPTGVYGPTGPGGAGVLSGYTGTSNEGSAYTIALTGAQFVPSATGVPEPGAAALLATAAAASLLAVRRRAAATR